MRGQPWPELELHGRPWGTRRRGRGGGKGRGGTVVGASWGAEGLQEGAPWGLGPAAPFGLLRSVRERRQEGEEKKEKRRERRSEGKKEKMGKIVNMDIFEKIKDNL
jgi:hypothetical protein